MRSLIAKIIYIYIYIYLPRPRPPGGFFFGAGGVARKGLPADPDMAEMFTTLFVEFDKEVQEQRFLETVRPFSPTHPPLFPSECLWVCWQAGAPE